MDKQVSIINRRSTVHEIAFILGQIDNCEYDPCSIKHYIHGRTKTMKQTWKIIEKEVNYG